MNPISTVNDPGFRKMIKEFEPRYTIPVRKTIRNNYLSMMYEEERQCISTSLIDIPHFATTTDLWLTRAMHSYTGLTIHFEDSDFNLSSHLIDTKEFLESHTGENMASEVSET